jgi:hypothetical protein
MMTLDPNTGYVTIIVLFVLGLIGGGFVLWDLRRMLKDCEREQRAHPPGRISTSQPAKTVPQASFYCRIMRLLGR